MPTLPFLADWPMPASAWFFRPLIVYLPFIGGGSLMAGFKAHRAYRRQVMQAITSGIFGSITGIAACWVLFMFILIFF